MLITSQCSPLKPGAGTALRVVLACRTPIAGPGLCGRASQELRLRHWLFDHFDGPIEVQVVVGDSAGRADVRQILKIVQGGNVDLVLAEDLSRITRRRKQIIPFLEECQLHQTRVIAVESGFDTACQPTLIGHQVLLST